MTTATITGLSSTVPGPPVSQDDLLAFLSRRLYGDLPRTAELFEATLVRQRHLAWDPRTAFAAGYPPMSVRMRAWEEHVLAMGRSTVEAVLDGVDRAEVGGIVMASCTGYAGPTPELVLAKQLGLRRDLRRTFIGHMGCYAAFNALKVGLDSLAARPGEKVVVSCAEVCSLHLRPESSAEQAVVHALFGDAAAAVLLSGAPDARGPRLLRTHTETAYDTTAAMTWTVMDDHFRMTLSPYVPMILGQAVGPFVERLLGPAGLTPDDVRHWGIHPGGPKIVSVVGECLGLDAEQLRPSREILAEYGNCSSPTILLILERVLAAGPAPGEHGVFLAFGPGLTLESMLVRF